MDSRFERVRGCESSIGNFLADLCRYKLNCDCVILNGGCIRSDSIIKKGFISQALLDKVLAIKDSLVIKNLSGHTLIEALENGVSKYPSLDGRWPMVSNIKFSFDPSLPPGSRIIRDSIRISG